VARLILQELGADKEMTKPIYGKPHHGWVDTRPYPREFKTPDFVVFTG